MATPSVVWHGTKAQANLLMRILQKNCECVTDEGKPKFLCPGHRALVESQRFTDGLIAYQAIADRLRKEEFCEE